MASARLLLRNVTEGVRAYWEGSTLRWFPARAAFRGYDGGRLRSDAVSGLNVALLAFPQGMAYATIAGVDIAWGIMCSAVAAVVAPFFAASRLTILGPTNATALMVFSSFASHPSLDKEALLPILVLMSGLFLVAGAMFRLADLVQYISRSVVVGYITGAAILIIANQLKYVLGVTPVDTGGSTNLFTIVVGIAWVLEQTRWEPLLLATGTFILWWLFGRRFPRIPGFAVTLVVMSAAGVLLTRSGYPVERFAAFSVGDLLPGVPDFSRRGLLGEIGQLFGMAFAVAFLASLENSIMAKTLAGRAGERPNLNQDMLSVGIANVATSFLSAMPASGSLTRSALNVESGARTPLSSIVSGLLCAAGALTLGPTIQFIPKSVLAALVVAIAVSLFSPRNLRICLAATRSDAVTLAVTLVATLLMPLHVAIFVGVGTSIALYLRKASRPQLVEYEFNEEGNLREAEGGRPRQHPMISIVHVEGALFFGAAELFRTQIQRVCNDPNLKVIVLRMKNAYHLDATSVMALEELIRYLRENDRHLIVSGAMKDVYRVLKNSGLVDVLGRENIFPGSTQNPNLATRNALKRAQELLGDAKAEVRIYYDPSRPVE